jgi:DNA-binding MarR family transcriptional regulator
MPKRTFDISSFESVSQRQALIIGEVDTRLVAGCSCLRLRHSARLATQLFDKHLASTGLTIGQIGVLAQLHAVSVWREGATLMELSSMIGIDRTTLNRTLQPLTKEGLVSNKRHPDDGRARIVSLTAKGRNRLATAVPHWKFAQGEMNKIVGNEAILALNGLLELTTQKLRT